MRFRNFLNWLLLAFLYMSGCALWFYMLTPWIDSPSRLETSPLRIEASPPRLEAHMPDVTVGMKR